MSLDQQFYLAVFNPGSATLFNMLPWIPTIGASTHDRNVLTTIMIGNGETYDGGKLFQPKDFPRTLFSSYLFNYNQETQI